MLGFPPVYATRLTQGLINVKLKEHKLVRKDDRHLITLATSWIWAIQGGFFRVTIVFLMPSVSSYILPSVLS